METKYIFQCFKNRTGSAGPTGRTVDLPQNRLGSMQKTVFDRTGGRAGRTGGQTGEPAAEQVNQAVEPVVEPASFHFFFFFFQVKTMSL